MEDTGYILGEKYQNTGQSLIMHSFSTLFCSSINYSAYTQSSTENTGMPHMRQAQGRLSRFTGSFSTQSGLRSALLQRINLPRTFIHTSILIPLSSSWVAKCKHPSAIMFLHLSCIYSSLANISTPRGCARDNSRLVWP